MMRFRKNCFFLSFLLVSLFLTVGCESSAQDGGLSRQAVLSESSVKLKEEYDSYREKYVDSELDSLISLRFTEFQREILTEYYEPADYLVIPSVSSCEIDGVSLELFPGTYTVISQNFQEYSIRIPSVCSYEQTAQTPTVAVLSDSDVFNGSVTENFSDLLFKKIIITVCFALPPVIRRN